MTVTSSQAIQVLHVDDEPDFADLTTTFLERESDRFVVETATSADEGLNVINDSPPDCVVSDYNMPGMDGLEFLQAVRETDPDLPFILFTGKGSEAVASEAIAADVTDYLQKGPGSEQYELLANRIRNAVKARREAKRADRQEQLMRLTEFAGDTGGFELDPETGDVIMTDGACRILNLPEETNPDFEDNLEYYHPDDRANIRQTVQRACQTGEQTHGTWRYQHPDGEQLLDVTYMPMTANGDTTIIRGAINDITDSQERQRELRLLQQAVDDANVAITLADPSQPDNPLVYVNDAFEEQTGYPPEETLGRNCRFLQGADTDPEKTAALCEAIDNEEPISVELRNYRKDGTEFWNRLTVTPIYDDDGQFVRYLGTQEDVTERKEREQELRAERRFIEQALDSLDDIFYVVDTDGTIRRWNEKGAEITNYSESELNDMPAIELFPEDERETVATSIETVLTDGHDTIEVDLRTAEGERIPYEFKCARLSDEEGNTTGLVGVGREIAARWEAEAEGDWQQALIQNTQEGVYVVNAEYELQFVDHRAQNVEGLTEEDWTGRQLSCLVETDMLSANEIGSVRDGVDRLVAGEANQVSIQVEPEQPKSTEVVELRLEPLDVNTDENLILGTTLDITEHKQREQEILELKHQYQTLTENLPNGAVFLFNTDLRYVRAGGKELGAVGISADEIEGSTPHDAFPEEIADVLTRYYTDALDGNSNTFTQTLGEETYRNRTIPVQTDDEQITYGMALSQNVTDQTERREKLTRQNERLDEFATVISHDLRNPLTVAEGNLELAQETCESDHLDRAAGAIDRSQSLIDDLLTLAKEGDQVDKMESVALPDVAGDSWQSVETAQATLEADVSRTVRADRSRLQQLFENLYRNSVEHGSTASQPEADDAVEHGSDDVTVSVGGMDDGFYVADTGPGVPEAEREDIFKAGYSTAEDGTGFGLGIVRQVADAHGWEVTVTESEQGGARFEVVGVEFGGQ